MVTGLVDAYNVLLSGALDDMQSVANAFLALYGMQGTTQRDIEQANRSRILSLSEGGARGIRRQEPQSRGARPAGGQSAPQHFAAVHDAGPLRRAFRGQQLRRGAAIQALGHRAGTSRKGKDLYRRLRALLAVLTEGERLLGRSVDLTGGEVTFYKNLPQDNAALAETLLSLSPLLSRQTILENLPWVADAQEELRRRAAENG